MEASPSHGQGQGGGQAAAPPGTHTHKGKKKHLLSLSEGMDLGRQQGSSLRNRCFSAFLVWPGGLPGRKKESPSRRRVNRAAAPGPGRQQGWAPGAGHRGSTCSVRVEEQEGKAQPRFCSAFQLHPRTKPGTGDFLLGKDGDSKGGTLLGYPHPAPLHPPLEHTGVRWRHPATQRPRAGLSPLGLKPNTCSLETLPSP